MKTGKKNSAAWTGGELKKAIDKRATVVTAAAFKGKKPNIGAMAVRLFLIENGYVSIDKNGFEDKRKTTYVPKDKAKQKPVVEKKETTEQKKKEETENHVKENIESGEPKTTPVI